MDRFTPSPRVAELVAHARRLRAIKAASRKFLALWALEQDTKRRNAAGSNESQLADPMNHDWSLLYLGSVLDD